MEETETERRNRKLREMYKKEVEKAHREWERWEKIAYQEFRRIEIAAQEKIRRREVQWEKFALLQTGDLPEGVDVLMRGVKGILIDRESTEFREYEKEWKRAMEKYNEIEEPAYIRYKQVVREARRRMGGISLY